MAKNHIFSDKKEYKSRYYGKRSYASSKKLKEHVTKNAENSTDQEKGEMLDWIYNQLSKKDQRRWEEEYEYEDIVDVAYALASNDKAFSRKAMEEEMKRYIKGTSNLIL